jgi:putative intracellular protease/amidase
MNLRLILACGLAASATAAEPAPYTKNVAIVLYEGVEILDFAGPAEVFAAASGYGANGPDKAFNVFTVSRTKDKIVSQGFIDVLPDYGIADSPRPDIIVLPGGSSQNVINDAAWMEWVKKSAAGADNVLTVCTGAFIAGKAGLLEGVDATTWYNAIPKLATDFPKTRAIPGRRFIDSGKVITTQASRPASTARCTSSRACSAVTSPTAPRSTWSTSGRPSPTCRPITRSSILGSTSAGARSSNRRSRSRRETAAAAIAGYRALIAKDAGDAEAWLGLGRALHGSKRYREAIDANLQAVKATPQRAAASFNLACSYAQTGEKEKALHAAEQAVAAGYRVKWAYENDPDLETIRADRRFKTLLSSL